MRIKWALMAEGITVDARGALAAVGLAQAAVVSPVLPVLVKRAAILLLTGDSDEFIPGRPVTFSYQAVSPSGNLLFENKSNIPMASLILPDVPPAIALSTEAAFIVKEYGRHLIKITAQPSDHPEMDAELEFYVVKPPDKSGLEGRGVQSSATI